MTTLDPCTCGEPHPPVVAARATLDGAPLLGWSDGSLAVLGAPSGPVAVRALALPEAARDVWRALDASELADAAEVAHTVLGPDHRGRDRLGERAVRVPGDPAPNAEVWCPVRVSRDSTADGHAEPDPRRCPWLRTPEKVEAQRHRFRVAWAEQAEERAGRLAKLRAQRRVSA